MPVIAGRPDRRGRHASINDPTGRTQHELDVVALPQGVSKAANAPALLVLGEAKSSRRRTRDDLARLEHISDLLSRRGIDTTQTALVLFSRAGFEASLSREAAKTEEVHLIDLDTLFAG